MRLVSFRIRTFRNIIDSGDIAVDDVTCLVGKNEAGKSAILEALHVLHPANAATDLSLLEEYPRWLRKEHEITGEIKTAVPVTAQFRLSDDEMEALAEHYGVQVLSSPDFTASRSYAEPTKINIVPSFDANTFLSHFVSQLPSRVEQALATNHPKTTTALVRDLNALVANKSSEDGETAALGADAEASLARLWGITGGANTSVELSVRLWLLERMPSTFYFSTYSQLQGRYDLDDVLTELAGGSGDDESVTAAADFLRLAKITPEAVKDTNYEASNSELEAISSLLSRRVKHYWKQNNHLKLRVRIETESYGSANGYPAVRHWLQFRVEDERHDFTNRLDRRSTGFQWFVSFLAAFLEFESDDNLMLLLDEPGLSLHARAQRDLLDAMDEKLAASRQVMYSTHSPFMVRPNRLDQARVVEDQGPDKGTSVTNDAGAVSDPDTLFPLEAALGYDIAETLFIGRRNIIVEGISDFIYLTTISGHLSQQGKPGLPVDARVIPAGGATNIPTFLALLGSQLEAAVLVDGNTSGQRIQNSIDRGRLKKTRIVSLDDHCSVPGADIEDLFTPDEYLSLYNGALKKSLTISQLKGQDRIVKRIERVDGDFDHGVVAAYFLSTLTDSLKALSPGTITRFGAVMAALSAALPKA